MSPLLPDSEEFDMPFWGKLYTVLSLDLARDFHDDIGVPIKPAETLKTVIRKAIIDNRKSYMANSKDGGIAEHGERNIKLVFGQSEFDNFISWSKSVFVDSPTRHSDWNGWRIVFVYLKWEISKLNDISSGAADHISAAYAKFQDQSNIVSRIDDAMSITMSEWDMEMYARHDMDFSDPAKFNPFTLISLTCKLYNFQLFWKEIQSLILPVYQDDFHRLGIKILEEADVILSQPLCHPKNLVCDVKYKQ